MHGSFPGVASCPLSEWHQAESATWSLRSRSTWLWRDRGNSPSTTGLGSRALQAQGGPEARAVVEALALLHLGGAALSRDVRAGGPPVPQRRLPALDALAPRAGHAHALLEAELLAAGDRGGISAFQAAPPTHLRQCADVTVHTIDRSITNCITRNVSSK